ncbi:MAG TPA: phage tail protein [Stellaceae bacterium]|jgi:phage tail-like protein|nr:phage tail protein [Stellaceae bacterium]
MPARDANDATWYVIRYPEDFATLAGAPADATAPFQVPSSPFLEPALLYDERRGVLELQPEASPVAADPPAGIAVDVEGDIYCVDDNGILLVVRCDGTSTPLICEPNVFAQPAGLALDRRGFLYVADPAAGRVLVLSPDDGKVEAVLGGGGPVGALVEPIDVAVAPASGFIYVADRAGGRIAVFSAGMKPLASFATAAAEGKTPQPIAVMIDGSGNLLVADAWLPRLQCYAPDTTRLGDVELATLVAPLAGGAVALGALDRAYGDRVPRFLVGNCGPCAAPEDDGGARLAEVHAALRLLALTLGRRFERSGAFYSRALDGGRPGILWHRVTVELGSDPPPGTRVLIETFTSDTANPGAPLWSAPHDPSGALVPFTRAVPEQLVQSSRGRFLWLRATLQSDDGTATPSIRAIRAYYPRISGLDLLPTAYRRDPDAASFTDRFLALFEHVFTGIEDRYVDFSREIDPDAAPREVIDWLAALIDLAFDPSWPVEPRRALVGEAISLYRTRGTIAGIERYVEIYTGIRPAIVESWLERPAQPSFLGRPGSILGCGLPILGTVGSAPLPPDAVLWASYAHRFTIYVYVNDPCDTKVTLRAVDRIVEVNKPAHTSHHLEAIFPDARVGLQSRVGLDFVIGTATGSPRIQLGDGDGPPAGDGLSGGILGLDTVLGPRRPEYVRRLDSAL